LLACAGSAVYSADVSLYGWLVPLLAGAGSVQYDVQSAGATLWLVNTLLACGGSSTVQYRYMFSWPDELHKFAGPTGMVKAGLINCILFAGMVTA
jgi:hypothetical protein